MILLSLWYGGSEEEAKVAYSKLFELGPVMQTFAPTPYDHLNDSSDPVCTKGLRKPAFSAGLADDELPNVADVWEDWATWSGKEGCGGSVVLTECYGYERSREIKDDETAYAWRDVGVHVLAIPIYGNAALDIEAKEFGDRFRAKLQIGKEKRV